MRFSVFAVATVPDTDTARHLFDLHDLDDKSVSKVLSHHRMQQTGASEPLRWDQQAIASLSLLRHSGDDVQIESLTLATHQEKEMLDAYYAAVLRDGLMVSWDATDALLPLLRFRTLKQGVSHPAYWQMLGVRRDLHLDVAQWLAPAGEDRPGLDEIARSLELPGLLGHDGSSLYASWLQGRHGEIQAHSDLAVINVYLLALRLFGVTGQMTRHESNKMQGRLRDTLLGHENPHLAAFAEAWSLA